MLWETMFRFCLLHAWRYPVQTWGLHEFRFGQVPMQGLPVRASASASASLSANASKCQRFFKMPAVTGSSSCGRSTGGWSSDPHLAPVPSTQLDPCLTPCLNSEHIVGHAH